MLYRCCFIESSWELCKGDLIIIIPILQIRELRVREFLYLSLGSAKQASDLGLEPDNLGGEPLWLLRTGDMDSEGLALVFLLLLSLSCVGLFCGPMHCSPPGSSVHGISQASILEGVAISSRDLPDLGFRPLFLAWQQDSLPPSHLGKRSNQLVLKEISYEHALEGWTLRLQYLGRLMQKDLDAGKDGRQEEKRAVEDEVVR